MNTNEIAAHKVADACEEIARMLASLTPAALSAFLPGLTEEHAAGVAKMYDRKAAAIRATAPFIPLTEDEMEELGRMEEDEINDWSAHDAWEVCFLERAQPWERRHEYDERKEQMAEAEKEELAFAGRHGL